jgi:hypothetical protein
MKSPVLCAKDLLDDPGRLSHAVLDIEDEWQLLSHDDQAEFASVSLADALELVPELTLVSFLKPGMIAVAGPEPITWFIESYDPDDLEPGELSDWGRGWDLPFSPRLECSVSPDLAEIHGSDPTRLRKVCRLTRGPQDHWNFFGHHAEDGEDYYPMLLRDIVALYPDAAEMLRGR